MKELNLKKSSFFDRVKSMVRVDARRMLTTPLFYITVGAAFIVPILILVMTTMMDGMVTTDKTTGVQTTIEGFKNVWQIISSVSGSGAEAAAMDMTSMCNMNLVYFAVAIPVCLFVAEDFRSGYAKNLFTVRARKTDYVISKTLVLSIVGGCMVVAFFVGAMLGGVFSGISFDLAEVDTNVYGIICCLISKILLVAIFVSIFLVMSVIAKGKAWLSILLSLGVGMFLFMMIPIITPLNATVVHVVMCVAGVAAFAVGLGAVSNVILRKTALV